MPDIWPTSCQLLFNSICPDSATRNSLTPVSNHHVEILMVSPNIPWFSIGIILVEEWISQISKKIFGEVFNQFLGIVLAVWFQCQTVSTLPHPALISLLACRATSWLELTSPAIWFAASPPHCIQVERRLWTIAPAGELVPIHLKRINVEVWNPATKVCLKVMNVSGCVESM